MRKVTFQVKCAESDYISPYISIANPDEDIQNMQDAEDVVIPEECITIVINYPLLRPAEFQASSNTGFTRADIAKKIAELYHQVYCEEDATKSSDQGRLTSLGSANRGISDGKYGIALHDIEDLLLHTVRKCRDGKYYCLVDS